LSLDNEDVGNAAILGNRQIGISGRKYKLRKTDERIRRSLPGYFEWRTPCEWRRMSFARGFGFI